MLVVFRWSKEMKYNAPWQNIITKQLLRIKPIVLKVAEGPRESMASNIQVGVSL